MTLKEELSQIRRDAIVAKAELEARADEEMRKIIAQFIFPLLRLMNEANPLEKELPIIIEEQGSLHFVPALDVKKHYLAYYDGPLYGCDLIPAAFRVGEKFDLDVKPDPNSNKNCIVTMTLDD